MKNNHKRITSILLLVIIFVSMTGFDAKSNVTVDAKNEIVYPCITADTLIAKFEIDHSTAYSLYNGKYYMVLGHVSSVDTNNKGFTVTQLNTITSTNITASTSDKDAINDISLINPGDTVRIYCKISISTWFSGSITLKNIVKVEKTDETTIYDGTYSLPTLATICTTNQNSRSLGDGKIKYYISDEWKEVEHAIPLADGKYFVDGYYYKLNELSANYQIRPEQVYIFYFDYNTFVEDKKKFSKTKEIEKAVVMNILGVDSVKIENQKTDYNTFNYCTTSYYDSTNTFHRVEFIMAPVGDDEGLCVIIYVYSETNYVDDILFLMRTMELN